MLKAFLSSLDELNDVERSHYVEVDGGFALDVGDIDAHPQVGNLSRAHQRTKDELKTLKVTTADLTSQLETVRAEAPDAAALASERQRYEAEIAERDGTIATLNGQLSSVTIERELDEALKGAGVTEPAFLRAARNDLMQGVTLQDGKPIVDGPMGPVSIADHVKAYVAGDGKAFVKQAEGGNAPGNDQPNGGAVKPNLNGSLAEKRAALEAKYGR